MFERFTDAARRVVVSAQEEARLLHHDAIGTEHLFLALLHDGGGIASRALFSVGITVADAHAAVEEVVGIGAEVPSGHIPFTPRAKKVLELSLRECITLGHLEIGSEHILLGVLREGEGVGAQLIVQLGAPLADVRARVLQLLDDPATEPTAARLRADVRRQQMWATSSRSGPSRGALPSLVPRCSLCGRRGERVTRMLVARNVLVCEDCARDAVRQFDAIVASGADARSFPFGRRDLGPPDTAEAVRAIERCFGAIFGPFHAPIADSFWAVEGGVAVEPLLRLMERAGPHAPVVVNDVTVEHVRFVDVDEAEVSLGIWIAGNTAPMVQPARAVLVDGTWKVSRSTVSHYARLAQQFAPPPD
jgi:Clp amino terminal domain, pathogenicity island component